MKEENHIFQRIKSFFASIFSKKKLLEEAKEENAQPLKDELKQVHHESNVFEETKAKRQLVELSKAYLQGKISEKDLTDEQVQSLNELLDEQIANAKRANANLKQKIAKSLFDNQELIKIFQAYKNGEIAEESLTEQQVSQISFLYDMQIERTKREIELLKAKLA